MPSIHAILLVALGGVLSADPRDDSARDRSAVEDPFSAQADYGAPPPRQPRAAASGSSPGTVRLPAAPLPGDFGPTGRSEASAMGAAGVDSGNTEPSGGGFGGGATAAAAQWESGPPEGAHTPRQATSLETSAAPPASGHDPARSIPLAPPSGSGDGLPHVLPTVAWPVVVGSLGGVIGLFLIMAWVLRRGAPRFGGLLPREVVEVLGRAPLADRKQMQLLRLGNKLVLIAVSPTGTDALTEITDPVEVDRLTGYCYQGHPNSSTVAFHEVFKSFETAPKRKAARGAQRVGYAELDHLGFDDSPGESDHVR